MKAINVILVSFLVSSCSPRIVETIRTEIQYRERLVPVTASINIPYFVERNVTKDTTSHLENPYAKSDAIVSGGLLHHSLESIPQVIETTVLVPVTDTLWKESEIRPEIKEVEREFTWWEKVRLRAFWWLVIGLASSLCWIFRKPLLAILKMWLPLS